MWKERLVQIFCSPEPDFDAIEALYTKKNRDMPAELFRYRTFSDYNLRNLTDDAVWLADPGSFNDPYDSAFGVAIDRLVARFQERVIPEIAAQAVAAELISPEETAAMLDRPEAFQRLTRAIASKEPSLSAERLDDFVAELIAILGCSLYRTGRANSSTCSWHSEIVLLFGGQRFHLDVEPLCAESEFYVFHRAHSLTRGRTLREELFHVTTD